MNKRLEQMMWKAAEDMPQCYYVPPQFWEKFAELIVQECVSVINTEAAEHEDDDEYERAWKMGTEFAVYQIKQHFGVEE